jgi:hypothetical protein
MDDPNLPEGYRRDLITDPDVVILRRPDGSVVAVFSREGVAEGQIERAAREDAERNRGFGATRRLAPSRMLRLIRSWLRRP